VRGNPDFACRRQIRDSPRILSVVGQECDGLWRVILFTVEVFVQCSENALKLDLASARKMEKTGLK
jgi:predicted amino acid dehydrogenase